jgi:UPF0755 protein
MYRSADRIQRRRRLPRRILAVVLVLIILLVGATLFVRRTYYRGLEPVSASQQVLLVTIESGTSSSEIAKILHDKGLIRSSAIFEWYIRSHGVRDELQAGTYALRPSMPLPDIVNVMVRGIVDANLVTIVPGQRLDQIRQTLINAGFSPSSVDLALDPLQYKDYAALSDKPASASLEGFLYPDSFQKDANTQPNELVSESLVEMAKYLTPDIRAAFAREGLSVYKGIILASIIEQEVSKETDRQQVAQVFLSRMHNDMAIGSDVTAFYGAVLDGKTPSTTYDSLYNTLLHKGLPPGPIGAVSKKSLEAVAHPANTNWLYFVAGDDGTTHFSKTYAEHQALAKKYCKKLCSETP